MNEDCLKLTAYFGERDRAHDRWLADAFIDIYARHELETSLVMRGVEGFGAKQHLHTDRLLTLSEDLPLVSVAVDTRERIEAALPAVQALAFDGLVTLERARLLTGRIEPVALESPTKLTVYVGRHEGVHEAVVDLLQRHGVAGATVLLGVDGTAHGERRRARFFGANAQVPLMIISVGDGAQIAAALPELGALLERPLVTLEGVQIYKRDGERLGVPRRPQQADGLRQRGARGHARTPVAARRCGGRHLPARRLGLPRCSRSTRRLVLATTTPRRCPDGDRRHARTHGGLVPIADELTAESGLVTGRSSVGPLQLRNSPCAVPETVRHALHSASHACASG